MSFTLTKEGLEMRKLLNNENWGILHSIFHNFCYYRGISIKDTKYIDLFARLKDEFLANEAMQKGKFEQDFWIDFFKDCLKKENYWVTELDIKKIKNIAKGK